MCRDKPIKVLQILKNCYTVILKSLWGHKLGWVNFFPNIYFASALFTLCSLVKHNGVDFGDVVTLIPNLPCRLVVWMKVGWCLCSAHFGGRPGTKRQPDLFDFTWCLRGNLPTSNFEALPLKQFRLVAVDSRFGAWCMVYCLNQQDEVWGRSGTEHSDVDVRSIFL